GRRRTDPRRLPGAAGADGSGRLGELVGEVERAREGARGRAGGRRAPRRGALRDQRARTAVRDDGSDPMTSTFTLINASAGSGKTHTLTHQIADRIARGLDPSQLIATTFTTKAAAELRDRVRRTLLETGQVDAARAVDSALISTVNSVSGELLREFALDAGISPDVQVLDED